MNMEFMMKVLWFCLVFVRQGLGQGHFYYIAPDEPTGDKGWDAMLAYMEYEEPRFDSVKANTAQDFGDDLVGFQTKPTIAREFGWDLTGIGQVPFAALLTNEGAAPLKPKYCMGVYVTQFDVITPCSCVRGLVYKLMNKDDPFKWRSSRRPDDLGEKFQCFGDEIEYQRKRLNHAFAYNYPYVDNVTSLEKCMEAYGYSDANLDVYNLVQRMAPAIIRPNIVSPQKIVLKYLELRETATLEWPPTQFNYYSKLLEHNRTDGSKWYSYNIEVDAPYAEVVSYLFTPRGTKTELSRDNFNYQNVIIPNRLAELRVKFCLQDYCNNTAQFQATNKYLKDNDLLWDMPCWCDLINIPDTLVLQSVKDPTAPHYTESVYGGLVGAPVMHKGNWVAWIVQTVNTTTDARAEPNGIHTRGTWSRRVSDDVIGFIQTVIPELKGGNRPNNLDNTRNFVIRDNKIFLPDADFKKEDFDLAYWNRIGWRRHYRRAGRAYSKSPCLLPNWQIFSSVILFLNRL